MGQDTSKPIDAHHHDHNCTFPPNQYRSGNQQHHGSNYPGSQGYTSGSYPNQPQPGNPYPQGYNVSSNPNSFHHHSSASYGSNNQQYGQSYPPPSAGYKSGR